MKSLEHILATHFSNWHFLFTSSEGLFITFIRNWTLCPPFVFFCVWQYGSRIESRRLLSIFRIKMQFSHLKLFAFLVLIHGFAFWIYWSKFYLHLTVGNIDSLFFINIHLNSKLFYALINRIYSMKNHILVI